MAIQDLKVSTTYSGRDISSLSDRPNESGISAANLKARFDQLNKEVIPNYNDLIDLLDSYILTNDNDILALENAINGLGISLGDLGISVQEVLDAYNGGFLSGVEISATEPTDNRIKVWIDPTEDGIVIDEANRVAQEIVRQTNENIRISSETLRIENEIARNTFVNYSNSTQYQAGNKVAYQGSSYVAKSDTIGHLPTDTNYWLLIAQKGEQGEQGIQGIQGVQGEQGVQGLKGNQWKGAYSGATSYVVDDVVSYNGSSYICILASLGNIPTNTTYFSLFAQKGDNTTATDVTFTPTGDLSSTNVQTALAELDNEKASKLFATNLVTNGDFVDTTGWTGAYGSISVSNNELTYTTATPSGSARINKPDKIPNFISGNVYYARFMAYSPISNSVRIYLGDGFTEIKILTAGIWTPISGIKTVSTNTELGFYISTEGASVGDIRKYKYTSVINLTAIFGAGKEPTKEQMDWLLAQRYTNSWFNGTAELTSITDLLTLVNTKADKTQEAWITPTLLNGWTQYGSAVVGFFKDAFGLVRLRGAIGGGASTTYPFILPVGYRPPQFFRAPIICVGSSITMGFLEVATNGVVTITNGAVFNYASLDPISFRNN